MKKILLLFLVMIFGAGICFATSSYTNSYRKNFPIKVYLPNHPKSFIIKNAFSEWSEKTKGKVKVDYCNDQRKRAASIIFEFEDSVSLKSNPNQNTLGLTQNYSSGNLIVHTVIKIGLLDRTTGKPVSDRSLHYIIFHEIGHAFGLQHSSDVGSIMYAYYQPLIDQELTKEDINAFMKMYKY